MSERGEHSREQEDCQSVMTMAMLIQLQEEFETLKKSNEEELSMLRAENAYMRQRLNEETMLNASLDTFQSRTHVNQRENKEESFGVTQRNTSHYYGNTSQKTLVF